MTSPPRGSRVASGSAISGRTTSARSTAGVQRHRLARPRHEAQEGARPELRKAVAVLVVRAAVAVRVDQVDVESLGGRRACSDTSAVGDPPAPPPAPRAHHRHPRRRLAGAQRDLQVELLSRPFSQGDLRPEAAAESPSSGWARTSTSSRALPSTSTKPKRSQRPGSTEANTKWSSPRARRSRGTAVTHGAQPRAQAAGQRPGVAEEEEDVSAQTRPDRALQHRARRLRTSRASPDRRPSGPRPRSRSTAPRP